MKSLNNLMKWQNYVHYILLALSLMLIAHPFSTYIGLEQWFAAMVVKTGFGGFFAIIWAYIIMTLYYAFTFLVFDTIIHAIFYYLPRPYQWRD